MITMISIQVADSTGMTRREKTEARRAGTMPTRDEARYVVSGTATEIWRGADRGTADPVVTVIDGTEVRSGSWLHAEDMRVLRVGDRVEVVTELLSTGIHWASAATVTAGGPVQPHIPDAPAPHRYRAVIDGTEYTGASAGHIAVQRYGDGIQVVADRVEGVHTVLDGRTVISRIHVTEIS